MGEAHETDYFVRLPSLKASAPTATVEPSAPGFEVPFVKGSGFHGARLTAFLYIAGGILGAFVVPFSLLFLTALLFWGSSNIFGAGWLIGIGLAIGVGGITIGVVSYRPWTRVPAFVFEGDCVALRYPGFVRPLLIPREMIRAVAIDDQRARRFHANHRFPIEGTLPAEAFADALDMRGSMPWSTRVPERRAIPSMIPTSAQTPERGYLYGPQGIALPFLRVNPEDVPNVAILLHEPLPTPRASWATSLTSRTPVFVGGRRIKGLLVRVASADAAVAAFEGWGVLRPITAEDVVAEGLVLPKPLKGIRNLVFCVLTLGPMIAGLLFHHPRLPHP